MSKNKSKIVKWEYVTEPQDVKVLPDLITRLHSPLVPWLSSFTENCYVHLRSCVQGLNEKGKPVKTLYCTRDGRFFVRGKDGWNEVKPSDSYSRRGPSPAGGGGYDCPLMRHFGCKDCHRCVAVAWCNPPEYVKVSINDKDAWRVYEVDHRNGDHANWTADNLEWVTVKENRRRRSITYRLKNNAGINPKLLTPTLMRGIFGLPREMKYIDALIKRYLRICSNDNSQMTTEAIRLNVAKALDCIHAILAYKRRKRVDKLMSAIGLDPKLLTPALIEDIYELPQHLTIYCLNTFKGHCDYDWSQLPVETIRLNFAKAIDEAREHAGQFITEDEYMDRHYTRMYKCRKSMSPEHKKLLMEYYKRRKQIKKQLQS